jgi:hypothetical protein
MTSEQDDRAIDNYFMTFFISISCLVYLWDELLRYEIFARLLKHGIYVALASLASVCR